MKFSLIDNLFGYLRFDLWGDFPEEFLNKAITEGIELWGLQREKDTLSCCARVWQIKDIKKIARECNLVYIEKEERSIRKTVKKYRFRYGILTGIVLLFLFVAVASSFLWEVRISGCEKIDEAVLEQKLADYGIKPWGYARPKDLDSIQLLLLRDFSELAFISINIKGCVAEVEVTERVMPPEIIDQYDPCNIVASDDGVIISVKSYSGVTLCKKNEVVSKGQLLVSGIFDSKYVGFRMVHAKAEIKALTEEIIEIEKPYEYTEKERTGRSRKRYVFNLLGLSFSFGDCDFEAYEEESEIRHLSLGKNNYLPISLEKTVCYEISERKKRRTPEEAEAAALAEAEEKLRIMRSEKKTEDCSISTIKKGDGVTVRYYCTVIKDIAAEKEIFRE